jgi:integrase
MARPPLELGAHGEIQVTRDGSRWLARCRYRDLDGRTRQLSRWAPTKATAQKAIQDALRDRNGGPQAMALGSHSRFREASEVWFAKIQERRADSTADTYANCLKKQVLPKLGELRLIECTVARLDIYFAGLESARKMVKLRDGSYEERPAHAANTRRMIRAIVSGVMQQAVLKQVIPTNPVRELERIETSRGHKATPPRGLTVAERRRLLEFTDTDQVAVRADMPDLIRFALGSGLRVGEICAVRWMDLDLDGLRIVGPGEARRVPVVAVRQNVYPIKGKGLVVHDGKSAMALRVVPLPEFVVARLRARQDPLLDPSWPLFASAGRDGTPTYRWPANVRRSVRRIRDKVDLDWMTPHTWRRTYATILDDEITLTDRAKADLMGQAKFLKDTYVSRGELHPDAAVFLDAALN